jgi:AraC-like DNA-binding protein
VVVIPPGDVHTGGVARGSSILSYLAVHIPAEILTECADALGVRAAKAPDFPSVNIDDPAITVELRRLDALMTQRYGFAREIDVGAVDDALGSAIRLLVSRHGHVPHGLRPSDESRQPRAVRIARDILDDCFADNTQTSLGSLALHAGVTPAHLVRLFTQSMGLSPHRYLVQTRVRRAKELLAEGTPSSFVAALTGFVDQSHLTTQFKRYVGVTPASYQHCARQDVRCDAPGHHELTNG